MRLFTIFHRPVRAVPVILLLCLSLILPVQALSYDLEKRVERVILPNGLTLLLLARHTSPTVSLYIRHRVGAVDEINGKTGAAHFLEHLMFKGTTTIGAKDYDREKEILEKIYLTGTLLDRERRKGPLADAQKVENVRKQLQDLEKEHKSLFISNEIDRLYTENGAVRLNASTGQDVTTYQVNLPANKIELWARIEADRMINPVFREFYQERDVVMEERRQSIESNPGGKLMEQFFATAFQAHPYGRPILGWPSDMQYLDPEYIKNFYKLYHAPNNTVIAVVGDIQIPSTVDLIKRYFGGIERQELPDTHITAEPPQIGERRIEVEFSASPQIAIGYHKPPLPSFDDYVFDVIESILARGRTSRFHSSLVDGKAIAESVSAANGYPAARYPNLFTIFATPRQPHTVQELEEEIYREIDKLKNTPVTDGEIVKTKNRLKADFIRSLASNSGLARNLSYYEILAGDFRYMIDHITVIEKVTPADIMRVAKTYLRKENRTVATIRQKSGGAAQQ